MGGESSHNFSIPVADLAVSESAAAIRSPWPYGVLPSLVSLLASRMRRVRSFAYWAIAVSVSAACVAGIAILGIPQHEVTGRGETAGRDHRRTGPRWPADEIVTAGKAMLALRDVYDRAWDDDVLAVKIMAGERELRRFERLYVECLHRTRQYWVRGDHRLWHDTAAQLPRVANGVAGMLESMVKA